MSDLDQRVETMYKRDVVIACAFVVGLWLAVIFVMFATWNLAPPGPYRVVLLIGGAAVLLFNTASIGALIKHYTEDKKFIYELDIHHYELSKGFK